MFNKRVFITIISSLIFAVGIALITDNKMDKEKYKALFVHKVHTGNKYDIIIAGDSRIYRGISSKIIGEKLNNSAINLGFSSGGHSKLLFNLVDKLLDKKSEKKIIILGITPASFTDRAAKNGHIERVLKRKREEVLEYQYLFPLKYFFAPTSPAQIRQDLKGNHFGNYRQEYHIEDGWIASWYSKPQPYKYLESYKDKFTNEEINEKNILNLYNKVKEWNSEGIEVYGFYIPSSVNMVELEKVVGSFDTDKFLKGFFKAGGKWINIEGKYSSYDGSHLDKKSAIRLSNEIADKIYTKDIISDYQPSIKTNDIYNINNYQFIKEKNFKTDSLNTIQFFSDQKTKKDSNSVKTVFYKENLIEAKKHKVNEIAIELIVYYTDSLTEAILACNINKHKAEINTNYSTVLNKWCKLYLDINIPDNYKETDTLSIYIDNLKNKEFYIDSLKVYYLNKFSQ